LLSGSFIYLGRIRNLACCHRFGILGCTDVFTQKLTLCGTMMSRCLGTAGEKCPFFKVSKRLAEGKKWPGKEQ